MNVRFGSILLKNSFAVACETSSRKFDLSGRLRIDDRGSVDGPTTPKLTLKSPVREFFNRIGRKRSSASVYTISG
jgi:hypothetical protein